jgi:hypothetical protein
LTVRDADAPSYVERRSIALLLASNLIGLGRPRARPKTWMSFGTHEAERTVLPLSLPDDLFSGPGEEGHEMSSIFQISPPRVTM